MMISAATFSVTPAHVQKGLLASLTLLVTLLIGQQYQRWEATHSAVPAVHHAEVNLSSGFKQLDATATQFSKAALEVANNQDDSIEQGVPVQVHQKSWIF